MIKEFVNRFFPSLASEMSVIALVLDGGGMNWLEFESTKKVVARHGKGSSKDLASTAYLQGRKVRTVIQGRDTFYGLIEQDVLDLTSIDHFIPFGTGTYQIRTCRVPSLVTAGKSAHFFAAALNASVENLKEEFANYGVLVDSVEVPVTALTREFVVNRGKQPPSILLNIGLEMTHLAILVDGHPYLARDFPIGHRHFAYHWQMGCKCTPQEADEALRDPKVCESGPLEPIMVSFISEIQRSIRHFPLQPEMIYVSGQGLVSGLERRLAAETGLQTFIDDTLKVQWTTSVPNSHHFKLALGLSM